MTYQFSEEETKLQEEACIYIKQNKDRLIKEFIFDKKPLPLGFVTIFMAGSPGAGKTEFSKRYMPVLDKEEQIFKEVISSKGLKPDDVDCLFVRIDVDEIRGFLPQYTKTDIKTAVKGNSHIIQKAANKGLDILREFCLKNEVNFLHDGTFGNLNTMRKLIRSSLNGGRVIHIFYIYIDPICAWEFTKARERLEGRNILKERFIEQYFSSKINVDQIKKEFGDSVHINFVLKNEKNEVLRTDLNISGIDQALKTEYNRAVLKEYNAKSLEEVIS